MDLLGRARFPFLTAVVLAGLLASPIAFGSTFVADFSTASQWDSSAGGNALWNTIDQRVQAAISANSKEIDFGDGRDGVFNDGPTQSGLTVAGSTITVNTDVKDTYRFSSFTLSHPMTLKATGSKPLTILVLGAATIAGTIDVSGAAGADNSNNGPAAGGAAGAGGGLGGNAGFGVTSSDTASTSGNPGAGSNPRGGALGANTSSSGSNLGGGGGCNGNDGSNDATAAPGGGAAGTCTGNRATLANSFESVFAGGAGGGGGGAFVQGAGGQASGSGGGGGGGALHFAALGSISFGANPNLGSILAKGGDGGFANASQNGFSDCGGSGGGGSGGSIWLQTKSTIATVADSGTTNVSKGSAAVGACSPNGDGGNGSIGILRVDSASAHLTATPVVAASTQTPAPRSGQTYTLSSAPIDTGTSYTSFGTPTETLDTSSTGCGTTGSLQVTYEGSNDGTTFASGVTRDQIASLNGNRYIRFKVSIATTGSTPPCLAGLSIPYSPSVLTDIKLKGGLACGTISRDGDRKSRPSPLSAMSDFMMIGLAGLAALVPLRRRRAQ